MHRGAIDTHRQRQARCQGFGPFHAGRGPDFSHQPVYIVAEQGGHGLAPPHANGALRASQKNCRGSQRQQQEHQHQFQPQRMP